MENKKVMPEIEAMKNLVDQFVKDANDFIEKRNFNNASHNAIEELKAEYSEKDLRLITFKELNKIILFERQIADQRIAALEKRLNKIEWRLS